MTEDQYYLVSILAIYVENDKTKKRRFSILVKAISVSDAETIAYESISKGSFNFDDFKIISAKESKIEGVYEKSE